MNHGLSHAPSSWIELRHASTDRPNLIVVPDRQLLVIEGVGHPGAADFRLATAVLRTAHEGIRARLRRDRFVDGPKPVLEIVWLTDASWVPAEIVEAMTERDTLRWRQMLELPGSATAEAVANAIDRTRREAGREMPLLRVMTVAEGQAVQLLHLGATLDLLPTLTRLHAYMAEIGVEPRGGVHQLVFGHPDDVPASRARSIVRLPVHQALA